MLTSIVKLKLMNINNNTLLWIIICTINVGALVFYIIDSRREKPIDPITVSIEALREDVQKMDSLIVTINKLQMKIDSIDKENRLYFQKIDIGINYTKTQIKTMQRNINELPLYFNYPK